MNHILNQINRAGFFGSEVDTSTTPVTARSAALAPMTCTPVVVATVGAGAGVAIATTQTGGNDNAGGDGPLPTDDNAVNY